jgi:hypothetical protein
MRTPDMTDSPLTLPESTTDVTVQWLNEVLAKSDAWQHGSVASLSLEPIGGIDSLASAVFKARIKLDSEQEFALIVKMHLQHPRPPLLAMYEAESYFYNHYAQRAGVQVPTAYFAAFDHDSGRFIVVQEFLTDGVIGTSGVFLSDNDLARAILNLADLHAEWWMSPDLLRDKKVRRMQDLVSRSNSVLRDPDATPVPGFLKKFDSRLTSSMVTYFETMHLWRPVLAAMPRPPDTLIHADCTPKNTMFPYDASQPPVLLDWAFFHSGPGAYDLAVLINESASPETQANTTQLLESYLDRLSSNGVHGYNLAELKTAYTHSLMFRSYGLPLVTSWGTPESLSYMDIGIPLMVFALENSGAVQIAAELTKQR